MVIMLRSIALLMMSVGYVEAFSSGAAACNLGAASPGGSHVREGAITGSLADGGFEVSFGMTAATNDMSFPTDTEIDIVLSSSEGKPFKGFLIRLGPADETVATASNSFVNTLDYREGEPGIDVSTVCTSQNVGGVTHTNNVEKNAVNAYMEMIESTQDLVLDVSVVVSNGATSEYYHTNYTGISFTPVV